MTTGQLIGMGLAYLLLIFCAGLATTRASREKERGDFQKVRGDAYRDELNDLRNTYLDLKSRAYLRDSGGKMRRAADVLDA